MVSPHSSCLLLRLTQFQCRLTSILLLQWREKGGGGGPRGDNTAGQGDYQWVWKARCTMCVCLCVSEWALSRLVTCFLCVAKYCRRALIVIESVCLDLLQGFAMESAWESSRGPEQDTKTEPERGRLQSCDKIPFFICQTISSSSSLYILSFTIKPFCPTSLGTMHNLSKPCKGSRQRASHWDS